MRDASVEKVLAQRRMARQKDSFANDPAKWAEERAGIFLWSKQKEVLRSLVDNHDTVVKAGHGVGKSFLSAVAICWWMDTRWPHGRIATTAPSLHQVESILWFEIRNVIEKVNKRYAEGETYAPMPGRLTSTNGVQAWKSDDGRVLGMGRKPPDNKEEDAFQGIHAEGGVLAIGDEAVGLSEGMIDALGNITSTEASRRLLICNPTNPASYVGKIFREDFKNWAKITISVFDAPYFTGEEVPPEVAAALTDQSYVDNKKEEYGEGTPRYLSRVQGEFAWDNDNSLIMQEDIAPAHDLELPETGERPVLGVDIAYTGRDESVIYSNDNGRVRLVDHWRQPDGDNLAIAQRIHDAALKTGAIEVRADSNGIGGPIVRDVIRMRDRDKADYNIVKMMGSEAAPNPIEHANGRAWWYDTLRYALRRGEIDLDPKDTKATDELMGIQYTLSTRRQALLIESKKDMKARGLGSPDFADAIVYATAPLSHLAEPQPGEVMRYDPTDFVGGENPENSWATALDW